MSEPIKIVPYDTAWRSVFADYATSLRNTLGDIAIRIDHIGSTAIPNLAAKPVIDIQVSVVAFEPFTAILQPMQHLGYKWRVHNTDLTKRYFREPENQARTHVHVRVLGSWSEQFALLFRDYLRLHPICAKRYEDKKHELAARFKHDRNAYTNGKRPVIWDIMQQASEWSQIVGWMPLESDA